MAKQKNNTWHRSIVLKLPEKEGDEYRVKFEASGKIMETDLQNLLLLSKQMLKSNCIVLCVFYSQYSEKLCIVLTDDAELEMSDTSDDSEDDDSEPDSSSSLDQSAHKCLLTFKPDEPLGNWEKYTRGIGSKLMMQMGYVIGNGLGKHGDGRIEPVEATVLPAGKSLGI